MRRRDVDSMPLPCSDVCGNRQHRIYIYIYVAPVFLYPPMKMLPETTLDRHFICVPMTGRKLKIKFFTNAEIRALEEIESNQKMKV